MVLLFLHAAIQASISAYQNAIHRQHRILSVRSNSPTQFLQALCYLLKQYVGLLFGTYDNEVYHRSRPDTLPIVNWDNCLNKSDPLKDYFDGNQTLGDDTTTFKRLRRLAHCLEDGCTQSIAQDLDQSSDRMPKTFIQLRSLRNRFYHSNRHCREMSGAGCWMFVQWIAIDSQHEHAWAINATDQDNVKGVGYTHIYNSRFQRNIILTESDIQASGQDCQHALRFPEGPHCRTGLPMA